MNDVLFEQMKKKRKHSSKKNLNRILERPTRIWNGEANTSSAPNVATERHVRGRKKEKNVYAHHHRWPAALGLLFFWFVCQSIAA